MEPEALSYFALLVVIPAAALVALWLLRGNVARARTWATLIKLLVAGPIALFIVDLVAAVVLVQIQNARCRGAQECEALAAMIGFSLALLQWVVVALAWIVIVVVMKAAAAPRRGVHGDEAQP
jgi:hypothetical protein